jgi:Flp pilus assembly pilin Flp
MGKGEEGMAVKNKREKRTGIWTKRKKWVRGQTLVEYALILAFISVVAVSVLISLGRQITAVFSRVTTAMASAQASH